MSFSIWSVIADVKSIEREAEADRKREEEEIPTDFPAEIDWEREDPTQWE